MDKQLQKLMAQGAEAEARARLDRLMQKVEPIATENYVRYCIGAAKRAGYDLTKGDVALIHPEDLPETVILVPNRDPVYVIAHPEVVKGKMLLVRKKLVEGYLASALVKH